MHRQLIGKRRRYFIRVVIALLAQKKKTSVGTLAQAMLAQAILAQALGQARLRYK